MYEVIEKLEKLSKDEIEYILLDLMIKNKIEFQSLNEMYVKYLQKVKETNNKELSLFGNCLGAYITGLAKYKKNIEFFESQSYVLLKDRVDDAFFDTYLTKRTPELIKKNEGFLKDK